MRSSIKQVLRRARDWFAPSRALSGADYWEDRARRFGRRAVLNLSHPESDFDQVTRAQFELLVPMLRLELRGDERRVLDFGCGPGRFTGALAEVIKGEAVGFDVSRELVQLAPRAENVRYLAGPTQQLRNEAPFDVIWICLVLGGIDDASLRSVVEILTDRLKPSGLLFLVENTARKPDVAHWFYRDDTYYRRLFPGVELRRASTYQDAGEEISVWAGRKLP